MHNSNFCSRWPANVSQVLNGLALLRATAKIQITPACDFRESILILFFFVCLHVERDFVFSFLFPFGTSSRTTLQVLSLDRDEAKSTSNASVLESHPENDIGALFQTPSIYLSFFFLELFGLFQDCSVLNLFWWPFLPLFHCEKECLSVPGTACNSEIGTLT